MSLKHIRYIDLSYTHIQVLLESMCDLYSLQILKLNSCFQLGCLPSDLRKFTNLKHLDLGTESKLMFMPIEIGKLTNLQTLGAFFIGEQNGSQLGELKSLVNLEGRLSISLLENAIDLDDVKEALLHEKKNIHKFILIWSKSQSRLVEKVLARFQLHENLKKLEIVYYDGLMFPSWIRDPSFSNLITISLSKCGRCELLPPLWRLPYLKNLSLDHLQSMIHLDFNFHGDGSSSGFPSLETLKLGVMPNLE